jgi:hypothetical protein
MENKPKFRQNSQLNQCTMNYVRRLTRQYGHYQMKSSITYIIVILFTTEERMATSVGKTLVLTALSLVP